MRNALYNSYINIIIIIKIYIAHMPDCKINRQIESEAHKKSWSHERLKPK